uniref:Hyaluronan and proteoglycan link protein 3 n=1 Tax=Mus musculus TaxID=10090 RepID=A0A0X1KG57_MOUSE
MSLLFLVLLSPFPCVLGLPFYNGFYYSNDLSGRTLGNGYGEGLFNGVKLVVETTEESLFSHQGASVTLPCHYHYEPALASPRHVWFFPTSPAKGATSSTSTRPNRPARSRVLW